MMGFKVVEYQHPHMARLPEEAQDDAAAAADHAARIIRQDDGASSIVIVAVGATDQDGAMYYRLRWVRTGREGGLTACLGAFAGIASRYSWRQRLALAWSILTKRRPGDWDGTATREVETFNEPA